MPRVWSYFLKGFTQIFLLCTSGFIAVLLVTRFQDIARFAASGAPWHFVALFVLYQIPFILPLAIPISCLIAALILFQKLSSSNELTALRAAGFGLAPLAYPLILCGAVLSMVNFSMVSEVATLARSQSKKLAYEITAINPLSLLQKQGLVRLKNAYVDMHLLKSGKYAEDVTIVMKNARTGRLGMMMANGLTLDKEQLLGKNVAFVSSLPTKRNEGFEHLIIENQSAMYTRAGELAQYLRSSDWGLGDDYLSFRQLLAKHTKDGSAQHKISRRGQQEIVRRLSLGLAPFTFTLIGVAFGMEIGRERRLKGVFWATGLAAFFMMCFIGAKSMKHATGSALLSYLIPHPLIAIAALFGMRKVSRGTE